MHSLFSYRNNVTKSVLKSFLLLICVIIFDSNSQLLALSSPPPHWSFPAQQPDLDLAPNSQMPSGGRPTAAKGLWVAALEDLVLRRKSNAEIK